MTKQKQINSYLVVNNEIGIVVCRTDTRRQARRERIPFQEKILKITIDPKTFQATTQIVR